MKTKCIQYCVLLAISCFIMGIHSIVCADDFKAMLAPAPDQEISVRGHLEKGGKKMIVEYVYDFHNPDQRNRSQAIFDDVYLRLLRNNWKQSLSFNPTLADYYVSLTYVFEKSPKQLAGIMVGRCQKGDIKEKQILLQYGANASEHVVSALDSVK